MLDLLLALLPGRLHRWIREQRGQQIDKSAQIGFGVLIKAQHVQLGAGSRIGSFVRVRANSLVLGRESTIASATLVTAHMVQMGAYSSISSLTIISGDASQPRSIFSMGSHSRIFSFCWLEPGHPIWIGDRVGIGGHGLIFTHGSWPNYFLGAPVGFGPVTIEDRVYLGWRSFVMPHVVIGEGAVIGAGSVVTKSIPPNSLAAGSPARVLRDAAYSRLDEDELTQRMQAVVAEFLDENDQVEIARVHVVPTSEVMPMVSSGVIVTARIPISEATRLAKSGTSVIDVVAERAWLAADNALGLCIGKWLTRYGARIDYTEVT